MKSEFPIAVIARSILSSNVFITGTYLLVEGQNSIRKGSLNVYQYLNENM